MADTGQQKGRRPPSPSAATGPLPVTAEEILESISDAFYAVDHQWRFTYVNHVAEKWWGRNREELLGKHYWTEFPQAVGSAPYDAHLVAARGRRVVRLEAISPIMGYWVDISIFPNPHGLSVYFRDITDRKQEETRQRLLVNELNHRVKNTLATVQAIAAHSLRGGDVSPAARHRFTERIIALSTANDLVVAENWRGAGLGELAAAVLSPHTGPGDVGRVKVEGPDILLKPKAAMSLALALHELATNAAKYGALSAAAGAVRLNWQLADHPKGQRLKIEWMETNGPEVRPPSAAGFGTRVLEQVLRGDLGAEVSVEYHPEGVRCTVEAPLFRIVE